MIVQTPHPVLPPFSDETLCGMVELIGAEATLEKIKAREALIETDALDPFRSQLEPDCWREADEMLHDPEVRIVALFGVNRGGKSWYAAKRLMQSAAARKGTFMALRDTLDSNRDVLQPIMWHFFPREWKALNNPRATMTTAISYSLKSGFTDGRVVLPNRSLLTFNAYLQNADNYEGYEFGAESHEPCLGVWCDENMTLQWLNMLSRRIKFSKAKLLWTYTPIHGVSAAMKEFLGKAPRYLRSKVAELLPSAQVPGLPRGHMPTLAIPFMKESRALWWHLGSSPYKDYTASVRRQCEGKSSEYVQRVGYGYAVDSAMQAFPMFGSVNVFGDHHGDTDGTEKGKA